VSYGTIATAGAWTLPNASMKTLGAIGSWDFRRMNRKNQPD
jgi:hypothetical protein